MQLVDDAGERGQHCINGERLRRHNGRNQHNELGKPEG